MDTQHVHVHKSAHTYSCSSLGANRFVYHVCACGHYTAEGVGWYPNWSALKKAVQKKDKNKLKQKKT